MKKVLLTNWSLKEYAGSEIDTFTIAKYFKEIGYEVEIATLRYEEPIKKEFEKQELVVYVLDENTKLQEKYDLIWAHHFHILDLVIFYYNVRFDKCVYATLSPMIGIETIPQYYEYLTLILSNSEETKQKIISEMNDAKQSIKQVDIQLFPNYAYKLYFQKTNKLNKNLKNICIVSNHMPDELIELIKLIDDEDIIADVFGIGNKQEFVDDELLSKYDVVISIGKTINYAIALGIPAYCYDRFGGPGYIDNDNFDLAYKNNFSRQGICCKEICRRAIKRYKR